LYVHGYALPSTLERHPSWRPAAPARTTVKRGARASAQTLTGFGGFLPGTGASPFRAPKRLSREEFEARA